MMNFDVIYFMKINNKFLKYSFIFTILSIAVHTYLTQHYFALKMGQLDGTSLCNINAVFNCDTVSASPYSSLFGIPMALWGAISHLILLFLSAITFLKFTEDPEKTGRWSFYLSAFIALTSIAMGGLSIVMLGQYCLFCMAAYGLSWINFYFFVKAAGGFKQFTSDLKDLLIHSRWIAGTFLAIPILAAASNFMILDNYGFTKIEPIIQEKIALWKSSPLQNFDLSIGLIAPASSSSPKMTIVEFADYRCPHCKHANPTLHAFKQSHPDVQLIFKPFPLDGVCNKALSGGGDGVGCDFAYLTFCAEIIAHKGWQAHDYLFDEQDNLRHTTSVPQILEKIATPLHLNTEEIKTCMTQEDVRNIISKSVQEATDAKVMGTPAIFVNGRLLEGGQMLPILEAAYRSL